MPIVKASNEQIRKHNGRFDREKIDATREADIELAEREEGFQEENLGAAQIVVAGPNVQEIRTRLKMSQEDFAQRFGLSLRTVQEWEQHRRAPDGPARRLLEVIAAEPNVVGRVIAGSATDAGRHSPRR